MYRKERKHVMPVDVESQARYCSIYWARVYFLLSYTTCNTVEKLDVATIRLGGVLYKIIGTKFHIYWGSLDALIY